MKELLAALSETAPSYNVKAVASAVASRAKSIPREDVSRMIRAVISLYSARAYSGSSINEFVDDICQAMEQSGRKELAIPKEKEKLVSERVKKLLSFEAFDVASKAMGLQSEHEHVYCKGRIMTDARPVFGPNPETGPNAVVISHILRVAYHEGSETIREIYFAMDAEDLADLKALINRAELKAKSLKALLDSAKLTVYT
jgi:hypothetical protein